jgi:hypothetical protein
MRPNPLQVKLDRFGLMRPTVFGGEARARSHCRFRERGTESLSDYGIQRMKGGTKRQRGRTPRTLGEAPRKDWQTTGEWIHWDQNPWLEPAFARVQVGA